MAHAYELGAEKAKASGWPAAVPRVRALGRRLLGRLEVPLEHFLPRTVIRRPANG